MAPRWLVLASRAPHSYELPRSPPPPPSSPPPAAAAAAVQPNQRVCLVFAAAWVRYLALSQSPRVRVAWMEVHARRRSAGIAGCAKSVRSVQARHAPTRAAGRPPPRHRPHRHCRAQRHGRRSHRHGHCGARRCRCGGALRAGGAYGDSLGAGSSHATEQSERSAPSRTCSVHAAGVRHPPTCRPARQSCRPAERADRGPHSAANTTPWWLARPRHLEVVGPAAAQL